MIFTEEDVANYIVDGDGKVYQVISYSDRPTTTIENVETKDRQHFVVDCLIAEKFTRLVKEK